MIKKNSILILALLPILVLYACTNSPKPSTVKFNLVDKNAVESVQKLHEKIAEIAKKGIAIGHQDDTSYGLGWKHENISTIKSDVEIVTGDFPAVFGFDLGWLEIDKEYNLDTVPFNHMKDLIIDAHKKGGIITISWHLNNPKTDGSSWDKTATTTNILKGGDLYDKYELWISRIATFIKTLKYNGEMIPIVFRPYHEMNGSWFWWGGENTTTKDYITLWQEMVHLLRDKHNIHNLLYAFSPNKFNEGDNYLDYYPGDDYADILGMDIYDFNNSEAYIKSVKESLKIVKEIATKKNKLYAFTETGLESLKTDKWFTEVLYPSIKGSGIAWVLTWRNYDIKHHYMPYEGQKNEADFIDFKKLPETLFLKDINQTNPIK